jgi:phospholipase C
VANGVEHVFVLMLENRAFDHMLGYSALAGQDAVSAAPTEIAGLTRLSVRQAAASLGANAASDLVRSKGQTWPTAEPISLKDLITANRFSGATYRPSRGADFTMPADPCHEFECVVTQLCGEGAVYPAGGPYPPITNGGFVANYASLGGMGDPVQSDAASADPGEIMKGFGPEQLPVLVALAQEFVVCDAWHASMPGPTWPNRFFAHAASSGGLDHSPSVAEILAWDAVDGFDFPGGTILDALNRAGLKWRIYAGDAFPIVGALKGVSLTDVRDFGAFASDLAGGGYDAAYTFIEPDYQVLSNYRGGNSQHPLGDVTLGEALIKAAYEAIRASPLWGESLLIVTWDEHGGFFDHAPPPKAPPPGDTAPGDPDNAHQFAFDRYGPRVPAIVISPLIPKNLVDHRLYDHTSILATVEDCFGLGRLTQRDAAANSLARLVTLTSPRADTPATLPEPAVSSVRAHIWTAPEDDDAALDGNWPGFLFVARRFELQASPAVSRPKIVDQYAAIRTRADARRCLGRAAAIVRARAVEPT